MEGGKRGREGPSRSKWDSLGFHSPFSKLTEYSIYFILRIVQLTCNLSIEVNCFASAQLILLFDRAEQGKLSTKAPQIELSTLPNLSLIVTSIFEISRNFSFFSMNGTIFCYRGRRFMRMFASFAR